MEYRKRNNILKAGVTRGLPFLVVMSFLFATIIPIAGSVELEGSIEAELLDLWIGVVRPNINLTENQTIEFPVAEDDGNFSINETIRLNIVKIGDIDRMFFLPRSIFVGAVVIRPDFEPLPIMGIKDRVLLGKGFGRVDVVGEDEADMFIDIPVSYSIDNETTSENLTMHVFAMGSLPGNVATNGEEDSILPPIISHMVLNLEVTYQFD